MNGKVKTINKSISQYSNTGVFQSICAMVYASRISLPAQKSCMPVLYCNIVAMCKRQWPATNNYKPHHSSLSSCVITRNIETKNGGATCASQAFGITMSCQLNIMCWNHCQKEVKLPGPHHPTNQSCTAKPFLLFKILTWAYDTRFGFTVNIMHGCQRSYTGISIAALLCHIVYVP